MQFSKKIRVEIGVGIYAVAKHLPRSNSRSNFGAKHSRRFCGEFIITSCGKNVNIEKNVIFPASITIGENSGIGERAKTGGGAIIGSNVLTGADAVVFRRNRCFDRFDILIHEQGYGQKMPVIIGDVVLLGERVMFLTGTHIGNHCVIGSIVTKNIPDRSVACGTWHRKKCQAA